jgi:hypothetical protein
MFAFDIVSAVQRADVAQLVEQPIRKGLSVAYVVVKLGIAEVRFWAF